MKHVVALRVVSPPPPPPRASLYRRIRAWFHGTYERLYFARARREALRGNPVVALVAILGARAAERIVNTATASDATTDERRAHYRSIVREHVAPGGRRLWPRI